MKVLVCAEHPVVRHGLSAALNSAHPGWEIAESDGWSDTPHRVRETDPDLLVIELGSSDLGRLEELQAVRANHPGLKIAILTGINDRNVILAALSAGVHGYILKTARIGAIVQGLDTVVAGDICVPPILAVVRAMKSAEPQTCGHQEEVPRLSARQLEVLRLVSGGQSIKQVARTLGLGIGTVKTHLGTAYRSLGARNRMEAVAKARQLQLPTAADLSVAVAPVNRNSIHSQPRRTGTVLLDRSSSPEPQRLLGLPNALPNPLIPKVTIALSCRLPI